MPVTISHPHDRPRDQETKRPDLVSGIWSLRPGTTLIELLIFLAIMGIVMAVAVPMLFMASENRLLQQTMSLVEQNGTQVIQNIGLKIRNAETILSPAPGQTGNVLVLQTGSGSTNPTIVALQSGSVVIIQRSTLEEISNEQVAIEELRIRNTSTSSVSQSIAVSFLVTRTVRLQMPRVYTQRFDAAFGLLPDGEPAGACNCPAAACVNGNTFEWYLCDTGVCQYASTALECS